MSAVKPASSFTITTYTFRGRVGLGDLVLLLYLAAFVRQYFWPVGSNPAAWVLTALVTAAAWSWHLKTKEDAGPTPRAFWAVVVPPLVFFYILRAALPDMSWDVLDYRLVNAERALKGWPMMAGDFFPVRFPFNPAPDMVLGLGRYLFGYRLGTVVNLLVLVWAGTILDKLLRPAVVRAWPRAACVLLLLLTEQLLFEVNNYMVDLLALPLMLEATRLALGSYDDARARRRAFVRVGLYLGAALAFKLTNLAFAVPLFLLCAYRLAFVGRRLDLRAVLPATAALLLPLLPYSLYIFWQTGNPVFPLYNRIFQSPFWPVIDLRTERWGPIVDDVRFKNLRFWEVLLWPLLLPFRVEHTAGDLGPHWGRVSVGFLASIAGLVWRGAGEKIRQLSFVTLTGALLWSAASGMLRYAMYVEVVGGLIIIYAIAALMREPSEMREALPQGLRKFFRPGRAAAVLLLVLGVQSAAACVYAYRFEWGGRPTLFQNFDGHLREARYILSDRSARAFLSAEERALFEEVGVWVESGPLTSGYQAALRPDAPQWCLYMTEFFETEEARARFRRTVEDARGKRVFSLALVEHFNSSVEYIRGAGLGVGRVTPLSLPFYSERGRFHASSLVEVLPAGETSERRFNVTAADAPLPAEAFKASLRFAAQPPTQARAGESIPLRVFVRNSGGALWPALGRADNGFRVFLGNHWLDSAGASIVVNDDARAALPYDLAPGEEAEMSLNVSAPARPGEYVLEIDLVQESVSWFGLKGSTTLRQKVRVE